MKKIILITLLLSGCTPTYSKVAIDQKFNNISTYIFNMNASIATLNNKVFPEAMKVSKENNNCPVDLNTNKCLEKQGVK